MRIGLVIVGVILLVVGLLAAGLTYQQTQTLSPLPEYPNAYEATLGSVTAGTMTIAWSGGNANSTVFVYQCSSSSCQSLGSPVAKGTGDSGTLKFSVTGGTTIAIDATGGSTISATVTTDGFVPFTFIGVGLAAAGAFLLVIGIMANRRIRAAPESYADAAPVQDAPPAPLMPGEVDQGHIMQAAPAPAAAPAPGPGQMIKCASCGTLNEMWLHNCRWCQRPLTTTAESG
ncbi:MAG: hypothetical protein L3K18_05830 [Thermoplasmata archaeon]|nr:hypothetical protein [Thermoplasmata archaeon]MCI4356644.1 hypothetical protein [Thermoplasmata archaeon]